MQKRTDNSKGFLNNKGKRNKIELAAIEHVKKGEFLTAIELFSKLSRKGITANELLNKAAHAANNENRNDIALEILCRLLAISPDHPTGLRNIAVILRRMENYNAAEHFIGKYLEIKPSCIMGLNTMGTILNSLGKNQEAIKTYKRILKEDPSNVLANNNLANEYHLLSRIDLAYIHSTRAIHGDPTMAPLWVDHLTQVNRVCAFDEKEKIDWWSILNSIPADWIATSFLQVLTLCEEDEDQIKFLEITRKWGEEKMAAAKKHPLPPIRRTLRNSKNIRIGFVSGDFRDHSVARFIWPIFENLNQEEFPLYCYSTYYQKDKWRMKFEQKAKAVRDIGGYSPQKVCETIRGDEIDILFELSGFTMGSRISSLAWRAAPIQVSWLGFPGTTGLPEIDYLFLDNYLRPKENWLMHEKQLVTNGTTVCFSSLPEIPITTILPEEKRGYLTLGTLNNSYKLTRKTIIRWSKIMNKLPTSHFLFVRREFDSKLLRGNILREFKNNGVEDNRIHFYNNRAVNRNYLDCYNEIDFTLDTYPVTGGTTTTDALWMGVPVIALEGPNIHQRVCSTILRHAGCDDWIANTDEEYISIALKLANNINERRRLRQELREAIRRSKLCDPKNFAEEFILSIKELYVN